MTDQTKDSTSGGVSDKLVLTEAISCGQLSSRLLDPLSLEKFWDTSELDLPESQHTLVPELRKWLGKKPKNALANYLSGKEVDEISPQVTLTLTAAILKKFKPRSVGVQAVSLMGKLIDRANNLGLTDLCPPPIVVLTRKRSSPFRSDRWPQFDVAANLRLLLAQSIHKPQLFRRKKIEPLRIARIALGQLLVSSIVHGGLISNAALRALLKKMNSLETPLYCLGERLFVELSLTHGRQEDAEFRRWFPDPLSSVLLMNLKGPIVQIAANNNDRSKLIEVSEVSSDALNDLVWKCIRAYLKSVNAQNEFPQTLAQLLNAVKLDLDCRLPMYLSNYSACESVSHSLKPSSYRRLHGLQVDSSLDAGKLPTVKGILEAETAATFGKADENGMHNNVIAQDIELGHDLESRWLGVLRSVMKGEDRNRIITEIDRLLVSKLQGFEPGDVGTLFSGFAKWMFSLKVNNRNLLAVKTARAYVISVSIRLGGLIGQDLSGFGAEEWVGLYEEALDGAETQNLKRKLVRALEEFQNFLEHDHGVEAISRREIFWIGKGLVPVDANVISESEFEKIRDCFTKRIFEKYPGISRTQSADDYTEIAWLILTLSYRCGLRRMEALKLDTVDVLIEYFPELLVRPTQERTLKSKSSTRKIPLYALLKPEELERLRVWVQRRNDAESKSPYSRFLFSLPQRGFIFVPQDQLFKMLHQVMREITGDSKVRFHHLRHAFASRLCVMLAIGERWNRRKGDDTACINEFSAQVLATLPGYAVSMEGSTRLRESLLGHSQLSRLNLWAVCELLGHSGPDVSVEHYIHHLDILLAQSLAESPMAPALDVVVKASDASGSQAYRHKPAETLDNWVAHLFQKRFGVKEATKKVDDTSDVKTELDTVHQDTVILQEFPISADHGQVSPYSLQSIWQQMFLVMSGQKTIEELCRNFDADRAQLETWLQSANWLFSLKKSDNGDERRHRFTEWIPDKRSQEERRIVACPVKPHEMRDISVTSRLESAFWSTYAKNPELVERVVRHYVLKARDNFGGLIFMDPSCPEQAREFMDFLKQLGLKAKEITYVSFDLVSDGDGPSAKWRKALKLHSTVNIVQRAPLNGSKKWACPWLGIVPVFEGTKKPRLDTREASAGFRFLMLMAAISMGMAG